MNVDDIIRKLQCCGNQMFSCTDKQCKAKTLGDAVELIYRLRAENERLRKKNKQLKNSIKKFKEKVYLRGL